MSTLLVGFDSAWTTSNTGALVAVAITKDGARVLTEPVVASFDEAADYIEGWRGGCDRTLVMLDQPTIVRNDSGCRKWERIASAPVGKARGGVQPASRKRTAMFGDHAPVWAFLDRLRANLDPRSAAPLVVVETYPVLTLLALGWTRDDGTLPKYNPDRKTFCQGDWTTLCERTSIGLREHNLDALADGCTTASREQPTKHQQDRLDALLCLLVGLRWVAGRPTIQIGNLEDGLVVVPDGPTLRAELATRLATLGWHQSEWVVDLPPPPPLDCPESQERHS